MQINLEDLTIDEMRKLKGIILPTGMNKIINSNTYYRIIKNSFKFHAQNQSLVKLREALGVSEEVFQKQLQNQWNKNKEVVL